MPGDTGDAVTGTVLGRAREENGIEWYTLAIDGRPDVVCVEGGRLRATGERRRREDFYDGSFLRVSIDGDPLTDP